MNIPATPSISIARRIVRFSLALVASLAMAGAPMAFAADPTQPAPSAVVADPQHAPAEAHQGPAAHEGGHGEHHLPAAAPVLLDFGIFKVNNSMVLTWIVAAFIILFAQIATRNIKEVPEGAQNFWEFLVEGLRNFLEGIIGRDLTRKTFWFFATIFIFILATNWFGLIPGVGTVGWGHNTAHGFVLDRPLLRGSNADLNMTLAMSMIFFVCWLYWALKANGPGGFIMHIFGPKGGLKGIMGIVMTAVFLVVGLLEVVSILFRPISLSFRLYGNVFAGESLLESMAAVYPPLAPIIPLPFYFMELLVGLVQALVFMLLTAVFTLLICEHHEEEGHEHGKAHH
jgi:F-type H+-transporting ATPase subunit a